MIVEVKHTDGTIERILGVDRTYGFDSERILIVLFNDGDKIRYSTNNIVYLREYKNED